MKVVLTAFQGKLKSEPMDWPDSQPPKIYMRMDIERLGNYAPDRTRIAEQPIAANACFEASGYWFPLPNQESAAEYRLVGVKT